MYIAFCIPCGKDCKWENGRCLECGNGPYGPKPVEVVKESRAEYCVKKRFRGRIRPPAKVKRDVVEPN